MQSIIRSAVLILSGGILCSAAQPAYECSNADFVGKYAFQARSADMRQSPPAPSTVAGSLESDGMGGIIAWKDWLTLAGDPGPAKRVIPNDLVASAMAAGSRLEYEVLPDCRMRIFGTVMSPNGPLPLDLQGGLSNGGRKAMLQTGSPVFIGAWTAESVEPDPDVARVRRLLERVARRLSVRP